MLTEIERRRCVFCKTGKLTKEHVMPQWVWREAHGGDPTGPTVRSPGPSKFVEDFYHLPGGVFRNVEPRGSQPLMEATALTVKAVCSTCNNGWMSELESEAKPIITRMNRDRSWRLTLDEVTTLRRWCMKTALMLELTDSDTGLATEDMFTAVAAGDFPPGTWYLALGRAHPGVQFRMTSSPAHMRVTELDKESDLPGESSLTVFAAQHILAPWGLFLIVRYSPFPVVPPARLDHDLYRHSKGRPLTLDHNATLRRYRTKDLPQFDEDDVEILTYWGHAQDSRGGLMLGRDHSGADAVRTPLDFLSEGLGDDYEEVESWATWFPREP